nr:hypothetical protein [uncultured Intestinimonas sp.]
MSFGIGLAGIIAALVFLTVAVYKGWSILYSSVISAIIIALTNGMDLYEALTVNYVSSFTSYAANYFILFCEGAMLGKLYDSSGAAWKIGKTVVDKCGTKFALVGYIAVAAILEYGGISTFVICFVLLPLAKPIFRETHTPWYMWPAITIVPIIGPELMTPGGLQSHNIIPTQVLGTDLMAAPVMGAVFTVAYFAICGVYFVWELKRAQKVAWKRDSLPPVDESDAAVSYESAPSMVAAVIPILAGVLLINFLPQHPHRQDGPHPQRGLRQRRHAPHHGHRRGGHRPGGLQHRRLHRDPGQPAELHQHLQGGHRLLRGGHHQHHGPHLRLRLRRHRHDPGDVQRRLAGRRPGPRVDPQGGHHRLRRLPPWASSPTSRPICPYSGSPSSPPSSSRCWACSSCDRAPATSDLKRSVSI